MTLAEWEKFYGWKGERQGNHIIVYPITVGEAGYRELWQLDDYAVSSVHAGSVYLYPRPEERK